LLQFFNFIIFSLFISTNVFIILLKSIYFETADDGVVAIEQMGYKVDPTTGKLIKGLPLML
jgi:hypothetical protein